MSSPTDSALAAPFDVSHRVTMRLLDAIDDAGLAARYSPRTRCVAAQFAHIHNVRVSQLEARGGAKKGALTNFGRGAEPPRAELVDALTASHLAMITFLAAHDGAPKIKGWSAPPSTFVGYLVAHEAHHRGLVIVSLRMAGTKLPQDVIYGIWDWSRV